MRKFKSIEVFDFDLSIYHGSVVEEKDIESLDFKFHFIVFIVEDQLEALDDIIENLKEEGLLPVKRIVLEGETEILYKDIQFVATRKTKDYGWIISLPVIHKSKVPK